MLISDWSSDVCSSDLDFGGCDRPDLCGIHPVVVVGEHDAETDDISPRHLGMCSPRRCAHRLRRLADDLQEALNCQLGDAICVPGLPSTLDDLADLLRRLEDVGDALVVGSTHRSTASAKILSSRSLSPPVDTTSTCWPSSSSSSSVRWSRSNSELSGSKSTRRSMSLVSLESPRATLPKTRTERARWCAAISRIRSRCSWRRAPSGEEVSTTDMAPGYFGAQNDGFGERHTPGGPSPIRENIGEKIPPV